jgi:hypothetical protein
LPHLGQTGQDGVIADDNHRTAGRNSDERRASARISSAACPGQAP